jgi:hypothetical protein
VTTRRRLQARRLRLRGTPPLQHNARVAQRKAFRLSERRFVLTFRLSERRFVLTFRQLHRTLGALSLGAQSASSAIHGFNNAFAAHTALVDILEAPTDPAF